MRNTGPPPLRPRQFSRAEVSTSTDGTAVYQVGHDISVHGTPLKHAARYRILDDIARGCEVLNRTEALNSTVLVEAAAPLPSAEGALPKADRLIRVILESLDDAKAEDVVEIDLNGKTSLADYMVIASGRSNTHVGSIADRLLRDCKSLGVSAKVEGLGNCDWVLVDAGDAIVHVFRPEVRQFYNLEKMWGGSRPDERRLD